MKKLKRGLLILCSIVLTFNFVSAQDAPTMFAVHTDNVKFEMLPQYEEQAKLLRDQCEKHAIKDANWTAISVEDGRYVFVTPIKNMADLDKNPMGNLAEKMGQDEMRNMFEKMNACYDSHSDSVIHRIADLSYTPEGYSTEGKNHREYHFIYYAPKDGMAMRDAMKNVKALFKSKNIKNGYEVYHSGFGSEESYFMVSIAGKDDLDIAQVGLANREAMGNEGQATMFNVIKLATRYDQVEGEIRPDLSYNPSN